MWESLASSAGVGSRTTLVQIPSRVLTGRVGWARASPSGCNPPANAVQVQLLPDTLHDGLVAQLAEHLSLKQGAVGSIPTGATASILGVSSNGKTVGLHPANEGSTPSTVHCSCMARWWNGRHAVLRRPCPPWREGSSPSLVTLTFCLVAQMVERLAVNETVAGSSPAWAAETEGQAKRHDGTRLESGRGASPCRFESCPFR